MIEEDRPFVTLTARQARAAMGALWYLASMDLLPKGTKMCDAWEALAALCRGFDPSEADSAALLIAWADQQRAEPQP